LLDIAKIPGGSLKDPKNRDELRRVIEELRHIPAAAVGIDVDFSPTESGWVVPEKDYDFFNYCLTVSQTMPVYLGVYRGRENGPEHWLNMPQFSPLAAYIGAAWAPDGIRFTRAQEHYVDTHKEQALPSMAFALVQGWLKKHPDKTMPQAGPILSRITEPLDENTLGRLVNFSKVGQLNREILHGTQPGGISGEADYYKDKIVILGRTRAVQTAGEPDSFIAPGWGWQPGVLYHASSAWTFGFEPVYEFNSMARNVLDVMLGAIFLVAVGFRAHYMHKDGELRGFWAHAERYALLIAFALVIFLAFSFMRFFQIMWLDAFWVGLGLLVHYLIPQQLKEFWPGLEDSPKPKGAP
jgi:CHASE2 domain-containing sensor protein